MLLLLLFSVTFGRQFSVDYTQNCFTKDGKCYQIISGTMQYIRAPEEYWEDRVSKFRAAGLNTLQTYIPWFIHEPFPGKFFFGKDANLTRFIEVTQKYGLNLIVRAGPYMDAEVDNGGFPWWLFKKYPDIKVRTSDKRYLAEVENYYNTLMPILKRNLYVNGGNIISLQVENEYGSYYACDRQYTKWLRDLFRKHLGNEVLLTTVDGNSEFYMKCGPIPGVFPTVDFGTISETEVERSFEVQQNHSKGGPRMNTEFYPGWFDLWGGEHTNITPQQTIATMESMWKLNASFNIYMFFGGTNFGYLAGAQGDPTKFQTVTTSHDWDSPLNEAGDPTPKYSAIRSAIEKHSGKKIPYPVPKPAPKLETGQVKLKKIGTIFNFLNIVGTGSVRSTYPLNVEEIDHPFGFVLYQTTIRGVAGTVLNVTGVHDRAYVFKNVKELLGVIQRPATGVLHLRTPLKSGDMLSVLVENQGRICYGNFMNDTKGLVGNITLDGHILTKFTIFPITLESLVRIPPEELSDSSESNDEEEGQFIPSLYQGKLRPSLLADSFLDPSGWGKGQVGHVDFVSGQALFRRNLENRSLPALEDILSV